MLLYEDHCAGESQTPQTCCVRTQECRSESSVVADDERSSREMKPFLLSYRPPTPETYRLMLGSAIMQRKPSSRSREQPDVVHEPTSKRHKAGDELLKRVRSLVRPLKVCSQPFFACT